VHSADGEKKRKSRVGGVRKRREKQQAERDSDSGEGMPKNMRGRKPQKVCLLLVVELTGRVFRSLYFDRQ
jgi:hypothetical protein